MDHSDDRTDFGHMVDSAWRNRGGTLPWPLAHLVIAMPILPRILCALAVMACTACSSTSTSRADGHYSKEAAARARCEYEANIRIGDFQSTPAHDGDAAARDATPAAIARTKQRIIGECLQKTFHTSL
ncbi:hypothetical protein [Bordetella bronchiseptica]|uniref:hypothetical protein n=2 Tax=Bordetella bronchiseptica TaxID=518 RepID=UPI0004D72739|nr:hypothetical protein [Bordetella bronchiseptica]SHR40479.1 Uncharacterised protein [Mycobacteroides abscessus subsp. abscessus]AWQ05111.1 hypothetical protein B9G73_10380 [Bordetella bronchiseptica]AWQ10059.1 hypothetical protein B9G72_10495 [Bordetella bronchiseptica]AZW21657.1 hypothetical protein CS345_10420 [Bordetella bronchiseptica]KDS78116.1 hypothetical protein KM22_03044 [Bordetella bronchiseptica KM22]